ncbi:RmlC-like cupin [Viridothelium virens]|uniref:RmlC-like cupin n=1 Tax=Viridothelium virens TaxID=1048519 RepID=A0A6A6H257_VIRVR|nr:RmlC-like cupin [Viridothelium virens]
MSESNVPLPVPDVPLNFVPAKEGEVLKIGPMTLRIMEDGSRTDNRLGSVELIVPPHTAGPPAHWHEMHDETFLVTQGTIRFHVPVTPSNPTEKIIDAKAGDYVTVPTRSPHTFSNPTGEESRFFNTFTPAFYINYFKLLSNLEKEAGGFGPELNKKAMAHFATLPIPG